MSSAATELIPEGRYVERSVPILEVDAALARELGPELTEKFGPVLRADVVHVDGRSWNPEEVSLGPEPGLGLILVEGLMEREVRVAGRTAAEVLGPGDILRPWDIVDATDACVPVDAAWTVLEPLRVAVLGERASAVAVQCPRLASILMGRAVGRVRSIAALLAIAQIRRLDVRILTLLWHLADRFGRVRADGVAVEVPLKHATMAKLLAATRPSVSSALAELAGRGEIERLQGGGWLLKGAPPAIPPD
ncbi:MAG: helix-turn-helix domain-containing protein [Thermoleophilaceae bacterium]